MATTSTWCSVLGARVTKMTDLEGNVTGIVCAEYDQSTGMCRLKKAAREGGPLAQFLERASENSLNTRSTVCQVRWQ